MPPIRRLAVALLSTESFAVKAFTYSPFVAACFIRNSSCARAFTNFARYCAVSPAASSDSSAPCFSETMKKLQALDSLSVTVIVDNESDTMSSGVVGVHGFEYISEKQRRASSKASPSVFPRPLCSAGHGLSLLLEAQAGDMTQTLLIDAGPNADLWKSNVGSLGIDPAKIETTVLSHYHWDHSGGLRGAVPAVVQAKKTEKPGDAKPLLLVDLQSDAVVSRGRPLPNNGVAPHHPDNPSAQELKELGAQVEFHDEEHNVGQDMFYVSGYIPRLNDFETGIPGHLTLRSGKWMPDTEIPDERYVACHVKNRGLVIFSACSHAGINNVCRDALKKAGDQPLFAVIGGFHLAGGQVEDRIPRTITGLKELHPSVVLAGHCTGWRAKAQLALEFDGRFQPLAVGGTYKFTSNS